MEEVNNTIEFLQSEKILLAVEPVNQQFITQLDILATIDSTNSYLLEQIKNGARRGAVCFAEEQTHGRGRPGRTWFSPPGTNIYCSMLWQFESDKQLSGLSIAVAVMVANTLKKYGISAGIQLKWPNDILFAGRKLAGILLENRGNAVVIGIGINLYLPPDAQPNWVSVAEITGRTVARNYIAGLLVNELITQLQLYTARGLADFLDNWQQYDFLSGHTVTLFTAHESITGLMLGINAKGELLLRTAEGVVHACCYGEVSVRKT